jgi:hypothetical protein
MPGKRPDRMPTWTAWNVGGWQDLQLDCPQSRKSLTFTSVWDSSGESPGRLSRSFPSYGMLASTIILGRGSQTGKLRCV